MWSYHQSRLPSSAKNTRIYLYAHDKLLAREHQDRGNSKVKKSKRQAYHVDKDVLQVANSCK